MTWRLPSIKHTEHRARTPLEIDAEPVHIEPVHIGMAGATFRLQVSLHNDGYASLMSTLSIVSLSAKSRGRSPTFAAGARPNAFARRSVRLRFGVVRGLDAADDHNRSLVASVPSAEYGRAHVDSELRP